MLHKTNATRSSPLLKNCFHRTRPFDLSRFDRTRQRIKESGKKEQGEEEEREGEEEWKQKEGKKKKKQEH